jgi:hypothetical protein
MTTEAKQTQCDVVRNKLEKEGEVSNKWAVLEGGIWRLGSRICTLRKQGLNIVGCYETRKGKLTKNYIYRLVK